MKIKQICVPTDKIYGIFNGNLMLFSEKEITEKYGNIFGEDWKNFRKAVGLFKLPEECISNKKITWHEKHTPHAIYYYLDDV